MTRSSKKPDPWAHTTLPGELQPAGPAPGSNELERFIHAQDPAWEHVIEELEEGAKRTHWMWFVFPQLRGLGRSDLARRFGIASLAEAERVHRAPAARAAPHAMLRDPGAAAGPLGAGDLRQRR
ncbi:MAG: DUF1810 family protein [Rubrivivax sp.]